MKKIDLSWTKLVIYILSVKKLQVVSVINIFLSQWRWYIVHQFKISHRLLKWLIQVQNLPQHLYAPGATPERRDDLRTFGVSSFGLTLSDGGGVLNSIKLVDWRWSTRCGHRHNLLLLLAFCLTLFVTENKESSTLVYSPILFTTFT